MHNCSRGNSGPPDPPHRDEHDAGRDTYPPADRLRTVIASIFEAPGASPPDAETVADVLVEADLRGVESHGSTRVPGYVSIDPAGILNPKPDVRVVRDTPTTAILEPPNAGRTSRSPVSVPLR